ncbi:hypothetical protein MKX01_020191 [Papaver californicum]|nr:hypothetical protein MKX01_020191 [Papaver californicum]
MRSTLIIMRDRGKNRKPLQRGRVSIEAIQTSQALKRSKKDENSLKQVFETMFRRLVKLDMMAVLRDLQRQNESEYWYKPQVLVYAEMIIFLADNECFDKAELVFMYMKMENGLEGGVQGFNALLTTFMDFGNVALCMECYELMRKLGCEPDGLTFKILINGLESKGEYGLSVILRQEAEGFFGEDLEFLEEMEEIQTSNWPRW